MLTPDRITAQASRTILTVNQVSKHFGGVKALRDVSLSLPAGQVVALVGENGAGKSTLINILSGLYAPDTGSVELDGSPLAPGRTHQALRKGIVAVHQELSLFPHLTVWENIFAGHEQVGRFSQRLRPRAMIEESRRLLSHLRVQIDPIARVQTLTLAEQQIVELAKALSWKPRILILDEATSALDAHQVASVFDLTRELKEQDVAIILVSHRMPEVLTHADQAIVLRDGAVVATFESLIGVNEAALVEKMVGRSLSAIFPPRPDQSDRAWGLQVEGLTGSILDGISLGVRQGEIVGLGGLQGHGQAELLRILFGAEHAQAGIVQVNGKPLTAHNPAQAIDAGIVYVPPDRKTEGLLLWHPVEMNLTLGLIRRRLSNTLGMLRLRREKKVIEDLRQRLRIRQRQWQQPVESLSGGNQQKVVLGKWLDTSFALLLLDEPTRGIDVATKGEIYRLLRGLAEQGKAILLASTDSLELLGLCDRVYVFYEGTVQDELRGESLNEYALTLATMGTAMEGEVKS